MKEVSLMRVLVCKKVQCPFICFCKPSAAHLYTSTPLKLESCPHKSLGGEVGRKKGVKKSCIRKLQEDEEGGKKRVQWMDNIGKQLAEIKEFESSETGDSENEEGSRRCVCVIL